MRVNESHENAGTRSQCCRNGVTICRRRTRRNDYRRFRYSLLPRGIPVNAMNPRCTSKISFWPARGPEAVVGEIGKSLSGRSRSSDSCTGESSPAQNCRTAGRRAASASRTPRIMNPQGSGPETTAECYYVSSGEPNWQLVSVLRHCRIRLTSPAMERSRSQ